MPTRNVTADRDGGRGGGSPGSSRETSTEAHDVDRNEVRLIGRLSGHPERRELPSGDELVGLRLIVRRPTGGQDTLPVRIGPAPAPGRRAGPGQVGRRVLAQAERLDDGDRIVVTGVLRRRWWDAGGVRRSRIEVAADHVAPC